MENEHDSRFGAFDALPLVFAIWGAIAVIFGLCYALASKLLGGQA